MMSALRILILAAAKRLAWPPTSTEAYETERDRLKAENVRLAVQRDAARIEIDIWRGRLDEVAADVSDLQAELETVTAERDRLSALINSPETENWIAGVPLEAAHQIERWGAEHDAGKSPFDWSPATPTRPSITQFQRPPRCSTGIAI